MYVEQLSPRSWCCRDTKGQVNTGFVKTGDGVVVFDTGSSVDFGESLVSTIRALTREDVAYVVNSHLHGRHCGGNSAFDTTFLFSREALDALDDDALCLLRSHHRNTIVFSKDAFLKVGDVVFELRLVRGHGVGSLVMNVVPEGVVFSGDILVVGANPSWSGGSLAGWIEDLRWLEGIPASRWVPGHGAVASVDDVKSNRSYLEGLASRTEPDPLNADPACPKHRRNVERAFRQVA